jgi:osmotically-inducible protein OsmY
MVFRARAVLSMILIAAGAVWTGCGSRASAPQVDDAVIASEVKARLHAHFGPIEHREARQMERGADQDIPAYIDVSSSNGVVTLTGEVHGNRAKAKAEEIAKSVPHVVSVINKLGVAPGYSDDALGTGEK